MKLTQKNDPEYKNIEAEVKEVLKKFQEGYIKRDKNLVDSYMNELFAKNSDIVIVGTCDNEWCLGFDEAREIVDSDWQYWGDVRIDIQKSDISAKGNIAWFITEGSVKYSFEDSDGKYERWLNSIKEHFDEDGEYAKLTDKAKLTQINWMLSLFMGSRPDKKRSYKWPLRLTGVLEKADGKWVFRYMQFCLPNKADYCDVRYATLDELEKEYKASKEKLYEFKESNPMYYNTELSDILKNFQNEYVLCDSSEFVSKYFLSDEDINVTDMVKGTFTGASAIIGIIEENKHQWDSLYLDSSRAITAISDDAAWVTASGYIKKSVKEDAAIAKQIENIKKLIKGDDSQGNLSPQDKLFEIRKEISLMFIETSKGDDYFLPIRFEGVLLKDNGVYKFYNARFSYPYNWVIEGHYLVEPELTEKGE